jgi:hypothetical protein
MVLGEHALGLILLVVDIHPSRRFRKEERCDENDNTEQQLNPDDESPG